VIREIQIENFKSIKKLKLDLGRINVFIGENGSGKSNILEAIALAGAAIADKLDNEFLASRGIRTSEARHMRCALKGEESVDSITVTIAASDGTNADISLSHDGKPYSNWKQQEDFAHFLSEKASETLSNARELLKKMRPLSETRPETISAIRSLLSDLSTALASGAENARCLKEFVIYSPENHALRVFQKEGQIEPLGIQGEGLLKFLQVLNEANEHEAAFAGIRQRLKVLGWFEDLRVPDPSTSLAARIEIQDRYLREGAGTLDQISANEGFLFLLFYFCLFSTKLTPGFFAVDNVDASLNPKLCAHLVIELAKLAEENDKQAILTTHNPAMLDGLDLSDDEQRLFVISRGDEGETKIRRIKQKDGNAADVKLSTAFINGYLGGLPKNF